MRLTDYKYKKARKLIKTSRVNKGIKELMFCALRQYKAGIIPETGVYQRCYNNSMSACLVGAALADRIGRVDNVNDTAFWVDMAEHEFKVSDDQIGQIIEGFDADRNHKLSSTAGKLAQTISTLLDANDFDEEGNLLPSQF